jgi:hypothetical protein
VPEENLDIDDTDAPESSVIRELREKANKADAAEKKATELQTENALLRAGLDLSDAKRKALLATHDGELTADALKATARDLGFIADTDATPPENEQPQIPADEQQQLQRIQNATSTAPASEAQEESIQAKIAEFRANGDEAAARKWMREQGMLVDGQ